MFKKICFSPSGDIVDTHDKDEILANPKLVKQMSKLASSIRSIAPRSDDFLYFSIVFLKSAESALLSGDGGIKKVGSEDAWGFFDENWKWHGNVPPHRNNNKDIFPESELKKATAKWVGLPLCRDHESSSVDGIRGIILDTHYDEKFKQVVGLCALDKVNYPDLARKVQTGMVRYGSMGTAVETSVCSECLNKATTQKEYCQHILNKTAHGEVNVGLKPIEYSLVVQPAEPGAILLKCIASLQEYSSEFMNYGVDNVDAMLGSLSAKQAEHLDGIMKTACGSDGCSVPERKNIVRSFLSNNGLLKAGADNHSDESETVRNTAEALNAISNAVGVMSGFDLPPEAEAAMLSLIGELKGSSREDLSTTPTERFTTYENVEGSTLPGDVREQSAVSSRIGYMGGGDTGSDPGGNGSAFSPEDDVLSQVHPDGGEPLTGITANISSNAKVANGADDYVDDFSINSIVEDIMNESRMRKRAELRRRIAYMQGGAEGREPNTFKSEEYSKDQDRNMVGVDDLNKKEREDIAAKEKLSRAKLEERRLKRLAYMQGGSEGREPNTFTSADYKAVRDGQDKQMLQGGNMGGNKGSWPGDEQAKATQHRASIASSGLTKSAYEGPSLSTKFSVRRNSDGTVDHANSAFEVFAGDKRVVAATAGEIFGEELGENWAWLKSQEYGREVCSQIRALGLDHVTSLLKTAQEDMPGGDMELPELDAEPAGGDMELPELDAEPAGGDMEPMDAQPEEAEEAEENPAEGIDNRLAEIEQMLDEVRDLVSQLEDQRLADVDVNVFTGKGKSGDEDISAESGGLGALSSHMLTNLKKAYHRLDSSADELSMVSETYDNISKLSSSQQTEFVKLANSAVVDADQTTGEVRALVRMASEMSNAVHDAPVAYAEDFALEELDAAEDFALEELDAADDAADDDVSDLVAEAMNLRRSRRESILKQADDRALTDRAAAREALLKDAQDIEMSDEAADEAADEAVDEAADEVAGEAADEVAGEAYALDSIEASLDNSVRGALASKVAEKRADQDRENYRIKLRRAYDVGMEMQSKGLLANVKTALDRQVDEIMTFDDNAFEAFKRSIGNARQVGTVKVASDLGGVNIGVETDAGTQSANPRMSADALSSMWE